MKTAGQPVKPNGRVCLATAIDAEVAAEVHRLAPERGSTVSAELRRLVLARLTDPDRKDRVHACD